MTMTRRYALAAAGLAALLGFAAPRAALAADRMPVVATFSILGDLVAQVGGDRVAVKTLVAPGGDAHVYNPTPADAKAIAGAKVVFVNGLGLEGWFDRLLKASGTKAPIIVSTKGITPREMEAEEEGHDHGADKKKVEAKAEAPKMVTDPHAWQSIANAKIYVGNIRDALVANDPAGADTYKANASAYLEKLDKLEADTRAAFEKVPADQRRVITSHDAFGYFGAAYGIEFLAPQGVSTEAEATAKNVAKLIKQIKAEKIRAIFVETITDPRLINRIAKESGVKPGGAIFSDSLSPATGPAATYIDMVRHNVKLLTAAMVGA